MRRSLPQKHVVVAGMTTDVATQLEIAAQHIKEAALIVRGKGYRIESYDLERVAFDCLAVAERETNKDRK